MVGLLKKEYKIARQGYKLVQHDTGICDCCNCSCAKYFEDTWTADVIYYPSTVPTYLDTQGTALDWPTRAISTVTWLTDMLPYNAEGGMQADITSQVACCSQVPYGFFSYGPVIWVRQEKYYFLVGQSPYTGIKSLIRKDTVPVDSDFQFLDGEPYCGYTETCPISGTPFIELTWENDVYAGGLTSDTLGFGTQLPASGYTPYISISMIGGWSPYPGWPTYIDGGAPFDIHFSIIATFNHNTNTTYMYFDISGSRSGTSGTVSWTGTKTITGANLPQTFTINANFIDTTYGNLNIVPFNTTATLDFDP
jgi:hypothetical protein